MSSPLDDNAHNDNAHNDNVHNGNVHDGNVHDGNIRDSSIRQQALDTSQSFAVSAPAGSGKTGLLTQRVLALLAHCEQPENIVAITFTKKAACEMQQRIMAALYHADSHPQAPEDAFTHHTWQLARQVLARNSDKQWQLLSLPSRLQITTIDSFCRKLSQQMPLSNNLGHTNDILDNTELTTAYQLAVRETLALLEQDHPLKDDLIRLIKHFNNQLTTVESLLIDLLARRDQWLGPLLNAKDQRQQLELTLQQVIETHLRSCQDNLLPFAGELMALADYAATQLTEVNSISAITHCLGLTQIPPATSSALPQWLGLAELLLTKQGKVRSSITKNVGFPTTVKTISVADKNYMKAQKQRMMNLLAEIKTQATISEPLHAITSLPSPSYTENQWQLLDSLTRTLMILVAQLKLTFQQLGKTDFIEVTLSALHALGDEDEPTDMALALDYRIQHILVDEFQDTSSPQLLLLQRLTAGWQPGDGRTLFVVGDAMQSCYSFRDANVGIFLNIREHGLGDICLTPLNLCVNFRSQEQLVNWCNHIFHPLFPNQNDINQGAVSYQQAIAFNSAGVTPAVQHTLFAYRESIENRQDEAQKIVEIIHSIQQQKPDEHIAILVRKRSQVNEITQALNNADIYHRAVNIDRLDTSMVIMDLLTLTRGLLYPNDRIAWLSLLRAPYCGLDMFDLYAVANQAKSTTAATNTNNDTNTNKTSTIPHILTVITHYSKQISLSDDGKKRLAHFSNTINNIFHIQGRATTRQWLEGAWLQLGGNALLVNDSEYQAVCQFFTLMEKYQSGRGIRDWDAFVRAVNQLYRNDFIEDKRRNYPPVDIMTIHKSKGLEFDRVIIPGIDLSAAPDKQQLLEWLEWLDSKLATRLIISPVQATGAEPDTIHRYIRRQKQQKQALEADRLFYVACTRAIQQLHLLGYAKMKSHNDHSLDKTSPNTDATTSNTENMNTESTRIESIGIENIDETSIPKNTPLAKIWPYIRDEATILPIEHTPHHSTSKQRHPCALIRQKSPWNTPAYLPSSLLEKYRLSHHQEASSNNNPSNNPNNKTNNNHASTDTLTQRHSRYLGIVLHSALQHIVESDYRLWNSKRVQAQQACWQTQLTQLGTPPQLAKSYTNKIAASISGLLNNTRHHWLLDHQQQESACELSLWTMVKGEMKEYIIDRTFIDITTRTRWVIDYKSSEPSNEQTIEAFTRHEALTYQKQLARYKRLFNDEYTIRTALFFPFIHHFHEVSDS